MFENKNYKPLSASELSMGWVTHGLGWVEIFQFLVGWVGSTIAKVLKNLKGLRWVWSACGGSGVTRVFHVLGSKSNEVRPRPEFLGGRGCTGPESKMLCHEVTGPLHKQVGKHDRNCLLQ